VLEYLRPEPPGWAFTGSEFLLHLSVRPPPRGREGESRSLCGTMFGSGGCSTAWLPRNGWSRSPKTARHLTPDRAPERRPTRYIERAGPMRIAHDGPLAHEASNVCGVPQRLWDRRGQTMRDASRRTAPLGRSSRHQPCVPSSKASSPRALPLRAESER
jgi:hypothetical protein